MLAKFIRLLPLILVFLGFAVAWGALVESVTTHRKLDDARCQIYEQKLEVNGNRITALETNQRVILETLVDLKLGQKEILKRLH